MEFPHSQSHHVFLIAAAQCQTPGQDMLDAEALHFSEAAVHFVPIYSIYLPSLLSVLCG